MTLYLQGGGSVLIKDRKGLTALHYAASNGHADFVKILCDSNADLEAEDRLGATPIFYAVRYNEKECAKMLAEYGANLTHKK